MNKIGTIILVIVVSLAVLINIGVLQYRAHFADYTDLFAKPYNALSGVFDKIFPAVSNSKWALYRVSADPGSAISDIEYICVNPPPAHFPLAGSGLLYNDVFVERCNNSHYLGWRVCLKVTVFPPAVRHVLISSHYGGSGEHTFPVSLNGPIIFNSEADMEAYIAQNFE